MRDDDARLLDMLLAAREAMSFVGGLTFPEFQRNRMAQLAILKSIEVVSSPHDVLAQPSQRSRTMLPQSSREARGCPAGRGRWHRTSRR